MKEDLNKTQVLAAVTAMGLAAIDLYDQGFMKVFNATLDASREFANALFDMGFTYAEVQNAWCAGYSRSDNSGVLRQSPLV